MTGQQVVIQSMFELEYDKNKSIFEAFSKASNKDVGGPENNSILKHVYRAYKNKISRNKLNTIKVVKNYNDNLAYGFGSQTIWEKHNNKVVPMTIEVSKDHIVNLIDLTTGRITQEKYEDN